MMVNIILNFFIIKNVDEIRLKFKNNIKAYLGEEHKHFTSILIDFYDDADKEIQDLPGELTTYMALKEIQNEIEYFIIKEIEGY